MNDDNTQDSTQPRGQVTPPSRDFDTQQAAAANITRSRIDKIYDRNNEEVEQPESLESTANTSVVSPYHQTHDETQHQLNQADWNKYHSSWQQYYQQYYEHYYLNAMHQVHQTFQERTEELQKAHLAAEQAVKNHAEKTGMTEEEAMQDLRTQLLNKVSTSAKKIRKSRHFIPLVSAFAVLAIFVFIQYNSQILAYAKSYTSPGNINPSNIIVDPNLSTSVSQDPRLIIPKINVDVPVDYNAKPDYDSQMAAMRTSVAYFGIPGANSRPGQYGNTAVAGHSSNDFTAPGENEIKFVFARLEQLQKGDTFYMNYQGTRYTYTVTESKVVKPTDVTALQLGNDKPYATLITCTPLGTATNRLLVIGEQVRPAPSDASKAPEKTSTTSDNTKMAGKSPTLLEQAFGAH